MRELDGHDKIRLEVEDSLASAIADISNEFIGWSELKDRMLTVFPNKNYLRVWYEKFKKFQENGGYDQLPREAPFFEDLRDELRIMLNDRVNNSDDLTRIAAMNYKKRLWKDYDDYNPKVFLKPMLKHNGVMFQFWGYPGSGKTDFALKQVDNALDMGYTVITNIYSLDATLIRFGKAVPSRRDTRPNFFRTVRMSDLLYKSILCVEQKLNIVVAWDEISTFWHRQDAATKSSIDLSRFIRLIRKLNLNIFFIEQIDEGLASVTNEMLAAKFHKESQKKVHYSTRFLDKNYNLKLEHVPPTSLHFKTQDFAGFRNDIDFRGMFDSIALEDQGDKLPEIKAYLEAIIATSSSSKKKQKKTRKRKKT